MKFQHGVVAYSAETGSVLMPAKIAARWTASGGAGALGYPKAAPQTLSSNGGGSLQEFTRGTIWLSPLGAFAMGSGAYRTGYLNAGGPSGRWGWPAGAATCRLAADGCTMLFQHGLGAYAPATGVVLIPTVLAGEWTRRGGPLSPLAYPVASATVKGDLTSQRFQGGTLTFDKATGTYR